MVLTQNEGYRKPPPRFRTLGRVLLARYPAIYRAMRRRHVEYNASLDLVAALERAGSAFVLRPVRPLVVGRMERDLTRLEALYRQGLRGDGGAHARARGLARAVARGHGVARGRFLAVRIAGCGPGREPRGLWVEPGRITPVCEGSP